MWNTTFPCPLNSGFVSLGGKEMIPTFLHAFVKNCCFLPLTWSLHWETLPETVLAGPGAAAPRPAVSRCGRPLRGGGGGPTWPVNHQHGRISSTVSDIEPPDEGQKTTKYLQMHAKMCHFYCAEEHETWVFRTWIGGLHARRHESKTCTDNSISHRLLNTYGIGTRPWTCTDTVRSVRSGIYAYGGLSHFARIFRLRWAVCSQIERKRQNRGQPALA